MAETPLEIDPDSIAGALRSTERRTGRTTALLVVAAQLADFGVPSVAIVAHDFKFANTMADMFEKVLAALSFDKDHDQISRVKTTWCVRTTTFHFVSKSSRSWDQGGGFDVVLWDHYARGVQ